MPRIALYAGSFDPVTNGHLDVVRQAVRLADRLVLAIGVHPGKTPMFPFEERLAMLTETCGPIAKAAGAELACTAFDGLVVDLAKREGATLLIRGLRDSTDFDYEMQMAGMNGTMAPSVQTVFLPASAPRCARSPPLSCARSPRWAATSRAFVPALCGDPAEIEIRSEACDLEPGVHMIRLLAVVAALLLAVPAFAQPVTLPAGADPQNTLVVDTTQGRIVIKLRNDIAPGHAARLKQLAREGFYNGVPFHRVIAGFMAQTGDGQNGNGTGGSKYPDLKAEFSNVPFKRGVVGMARKGNSNDSANSQWFIMFADGSSLNGQYTVDRRGALRHGRGRQDQEGRAGAESRTRW